jgi:anion-transporting  ArsA/GET3 family ATPase
MSVLVVELEGRSGPCAALGHQLPTRDDVVLPAPGSGAGRTWSAQIRLRTLTADEALVEYLIDHGFRRTARHLANSGMLDLVATAIPGLRDILVLGQIVRMERAGTFDLIVVDGPAAGHAATFLTSAHGLLDSSRAGPIRSQAADVVDFLSDPARCQVVLVTVAEETPVNETRETASNLTEQAGTHLGPVVVNDIYPRLDDLDADPEDAAAAAGVTLDPGQADAMRAAARFHRRREEMQAEQTLRLAEALPLPQLWLPHLVTDEIGLPEIDLLVEALETSLLGLGVLPSHARWTGPSEPAAGNRVPEHAAVGKASSS